MRVCPRCSAIFKAPIMSCSGDGTTLIDRPDDPHLSTPLGRFILESLIADGVTGRIYRSQAAAVRILYGDFGTQELIVKRMMRDVEAAKELQHPNVSRILDAGTDDGATWIATELAAGQTLESLIEGRTLDLQRVGSICAQIAAALAEAHEIELLHRNLAPNNVMVAPKGKRDVVKVLDFGLGSLARSSMAVRFRTRRDYAAPEALKPSGASKAADVYSLGLIARDLISMAGNGKTDLGTLVAAMMDSDPSKRPQNGRELLTRLDDLGYSPIAFPSQKAEGGMSLANLSGEPVSENLESDLIADGLVLVGAQKGEGVEPTVPTAVPDFLAMDKGLVVVKPGPTPPANTTFVYKGGEPPPEAGPVFDQVDIEESRRKLGLLENANKRGKPKESTQTSKQKPLLARPVRETTRGVAPNGTAMMGEEPPTELIDELLPIGEGTNPAIEVTASQMLDSEVDAEIVGELATLSSDDIEPVRLDADEPAEITEEEPIPLPSSKPFRDPAESARPQTPAPTLLSAAELSEAKAIGGVQTLPAEYGERPSSRPGRGAFRPKGSWPTEDLVLPSKTGASQPMGFGEDPRRAPTAVIRTRGVFSNEFDVPDRPGVMNARETDIIRPRSPSEVGSPIPRSDTLPIDRANTVLDPAEAANRSLDVRLRPKRPMIPIAAGAVILTLAAVAIALPRLDSDKETEVRRPVLIQAQPEPEADVAALDTLPEGDAPQEKEAESAEEVEKAELAKKAEEAEKEQAALQRAELEKAEREKAERETAEREKAELEKAEREKAKAKKAKVIEAKAEAELEDEGLPEGDDPDEERSKKPASKSGEKKKPQQKKRSGAKTAPKKDQPDKLERGTLIDPFAE